MVALASHQPHVWPWLRYLGKASLADYFVLSDNVQFDKGGFQHRNKIRTPTGWTWLTVSVQAGQGKTMLSHVKVADNDWRTRHLNLLREHYRKAPRWGIVGPLLEAMYSDEAQGLLTYAVWSLRELWQWAEIEAPVCLAGLAQRETELDLSGGQDKTQRMINLCKVYGADEYLVSEGGQAYLDRARMASHGIRVREVRTEVRAYPQVYPGFEAGLSALDAMLNCETPPFVAEVL